VKKLLRPITSLVLSALVIFEPAEVPAQEPVRNPRLAEMLRDIPAEVARFQANRAEQGEPVGFRKIPLESEIAVILKRFLLAKKSNYISKTGGKGRVGY